MNVPLDAPYLFAPGTYWGMSRTVLRVTTTSGIRGLGETPSPHDAAPLAGELGAAIAGRGVSQLRDELGLQAARMRTAQRGAATDRGRALAGVEMALWDIEARAAGVPLHDLLGGAVRETVAFTEYFAYRIPGPAARGETTPAEVAGYCAAMVEAHGSPTFEGKVAVRPLAEELALVREVRRAIGPERLLRLDANMGWRPETARRALAGLAQLRISNLEEPTVSLEESAVLRRTTSIPFSTHEIDLDRAVGAWCGRRVRPERRRLRRHRGHAPVHRRAASAPAPASGSTAAILASPRRVRCTSRRPRPRSTCPARRYCAGTPTTLSPAARSCPSRGALPSHPGRGSASSSTSARLLAASPGSPARASTTSTKGRPCRGTDAV